MCKILAYYCQFKIRFIGGKMIEIYKSNAFTINSILHFLFFERDSDV